MAALCFMCIHSPFFEIAVVVVRFYQFAGRIINADHGIM
jgi:hypothetical protein